MKLGPLSSFPKVQIDQVRKRDPELAKALESADANKDNTVQQRELVALDDPAAARRYFQAVGLIRADEAAAKSVLKQERKQARGEKIAALRAQLGELTEPLVPAAKVFGGPLLLALAMPGMLLGLSGDLGAMQMTGEGLDGLAEQASTAAGKLSQLLTSSERQKLNELLDG